MRSVLDFCQSIACSDLAAKRRLTSAPQMQVAYHATEVSLLRHSGVTGGKECALTTTWKPRLLVYMYTCGGNRLEME